MENLTNFFTALYKHFNDRKIDLVIAEMTEDIKWANGMTGSYVYGHDGVKEYWSMQSGTIRLAVLILVKK